MKIGYRSLTFQQTRILIAHVRGEGIRKPREIADKLGLPSHKSVTSALDAALNNTNSSDWDYAGALQVAENKGLLNQEGLDSVKDLTWD
jgi:hypothetical protein